MAVLVYRAPQVGYSQTAWEMTSARKRCRWPWRSGIGGSSGWEAVRTRASNLAAPG
jgi:hypothetical protein